MPSDSKDPTRKNKVSSSETKNYKAKDYMEWNRIIEKEAVYERCK